MLKAIIHKQGEIFPHDPAARGYHILYRQDQVNHCPSCGRTHWYIGRVSAECGFCATALPLVEATVRGAGTHARCSSRHTPLAA
jgi:hypothetical protein